MHAGKFIFVEDLAIKYASPSIKLIINGDMANQSFSSFLLRLNKASYVLKFGFNLNILTPFCFYLGNQNSSCIFLPDSKPCADPKKGRRKIVIGVGFGVSALCLVLIIVGIFWRRGYIKGIIRREKGEYMFISFSNQFISFAT